MLLGLDLPIGSEIYWPPRKGLNGIDANALLLMALFLAGAIYVGLKLSNDRKANNRWMIALGWAAMAGYIIILGMGAHLLMVAAGL